MKKQNLILIALLLIIAGIFASCKEPIEPKIQEPPIPNPIIKLELGSYFEAEYKPNCMRLDFIDSINLKITNLYQVLPVYPNYVYYTYELVKDSIRLTTSGKTYTTYCHIINSTKFEMEFVDM